MSDPYVLTVVVIFAIISLTSALFLAAVFLLWLFPNRKDMS